MDQNAELAAEIRAWMLQVMDETGLNPTTWAKAAEVARTTIARPIKEGYEFVTSSRTLAKLAKAANVQAPDIRKAGDSRIVPLFLPVCFGNYIFDSLNDPGYLSTCQVGNGHMNKEIGR